MTKRGIIEYFGCSREPQPCGYCHGIKPAFSDFGELYYLRAILMLTYFEQECGLINCCLENYRILWTEVGLEVGSSVTFQ